MGHDRATRRFLQECVIAGRVAAFCTARVIDSGLVDGRPYIVSEYVPGPSLRELVEEEGPRTGGALDRLAVGTVAALGAIHRAGIVHRDFKPANVLCGPDGPRVIDFGIAKAMEMATSASTVVGTPGYMSPEQIAGEPATPASDMFGWAATMAYAATGRSLFAGESIPAVMHRILTEEPDLSGVDEPLRSLLAACLDKRPDARPSAAEALTELLEGGPADDLLADDFLVGDGLVAAGRGRAGTSGTGTPGRAGRSEERGRRGGRSAGDREDVERVGLSVTGRGRVLAAGGLAVLVLGGMALGLSWHSAGSSSTRSPAAGSGTPGGTGVAEAYGPQAGVSLGGRTPAALAVGRIGDRTVVAVAPEAGSVEVWDVATGRRLAATAPEEGGGVTSLAFAEVGGAPAVVWATLDGRVSRWTPSLASAAASGTGGTGSTDGAPAEPAAFTAPTVSGRAARASGRAATGAGRKTAGGVRAFEVCERASAVMAVVSREEGPAAAVGCADGRVQAWDLLSERKSGRFFAGAAGVTGVSWPGSGSRVAFGTGTTQFKIVDLWNRPEPVSVRVGGPVSRIVSHGTLVAASVKGEGGAVVYDARTGRQVCRVPAEEMPSPAALVLTEADGRPLLAGAVGSGLRVWDARTCERAATLLPPGSAGGAGGAGGAVTALASGPIDGRPGLVAAVGGAMRAWTLRGGR
ncbi:protein kinase, partial [Nonomuraea sp. RK-328]|nr:protein kinase [Nonomuraea sp. RK-328]